MRAGLGLSLGGVRAGGDASKAETIKNIVMSTSIEHEDDIPGTLTFELTRRNCRMQPKKRKKLGQQPPLPGTGHHCRAAVHLDAIVQIPTAARNLVSDPKELSQICCTRFAP